jgi:hypothetical protein
MNFYFAWKLYSVKRMNLMESHYKAVVMKKWLLPLLSIHRLARASSRPPAPPPPPLVRLSTDQWREYFLLNARQLRTIPWQAGPQLAAVEKHAIARSIQEFQLGESGEAKHLMREAKRYALKSGDAAYPHTLGLFIAEEHRHARDLGRVLDRAGLARLRKTWPDTVFRWLRHRAGLELSIAVLVTAEVVAKVYYPALRDATGSPILRRLCEQISSDEIAHVHFQTERLAILRRGRGPLALMIRNGAHRLLFAGTALVVWHKHGRAMRSGGLSFHRFCRNLHDEMNDALARADPRRYAFAPPQSARFESFSAARALRRSAG